ncbi:MAG: LamG-like jellyroll fold domain-containing protein [Balneola sp.]
MYSHNLTPMKSRFILTFLSLLIISTSLIAQTSDPPSGTGTSGDPYLISNLNELYTVSAFPLSYGWDKHYKQTATINASSTSTWNSEAGFSPIGNSGTNFTGTYDGNGYSITGLTINRGSTDNIGLFGYTNNATITDVNLISANITGDGKVGALIGRAGSTTVSESYSTGSVVANGSAAGGLIGENVNGTTSTSYSTASVTGNTTAGGLVGFNWGAKIYTSYATGSISGTTAGGLVGKNQYINSTLNATIEDSYATGSVTGSSVEGGLVGENTSSSAPITTSYFNITIGGPDNSIGNDLTSAQMRLSSSFLGFDFTNDWEQVDGIHFPTLKANTQDPVPGIIEFDGGAGSSGSPYQISTAAQLHLIRLNLSSYFILTQNIDLSTETSSGGIFWNDGEGFEPIGTGSGSLSFKGHLDGDGYSIDELYINRPSQSDVGFFSGLNGTSSGSVTNLALTNVDITGGEDTGALSGEVFNGATVSENYVTGSVTSTTNYTGGMIGGFFNGTMTDNYSLVNVNGGQYAGGLIGRYTGGTVTKNYSTGTVTGTSNLGGFIGIVSGSSASNNYWFTSQSGQSNGVGSGSSTGITGLTSAETRQVDSFTGFDFVNTWQNNAPSAFPTLQEVSQSPLPGVILVESVGSLNFPTSNISIDDDNIFDGPNAFTIELWMKTPSSDRQGLIDKATIKSGDNFTAGWYLELNNNLNLGLLTLSGELIVPSTSSPSINKWHHVATTYDGSTAKIYLDGNDVTGTSSGSGSGAPDGNAQDLIVGNNLFSSSSNFSGNLAEIRIWNVVRTQDQIRTNMFQPVSGNDSNLLLYWRMNKANGTSIPDETSNGNNVSRGSTTISSETPPIGTFITGNEGWRMMTTPTSNVSYGDLLDTLWTQGFTGADVTVGSSTVYAWDEPTRSFSSINKATDIPSAGSGFLIYIFDDQNNDGTPDGFPKVIRTDSLQEVGQITPALTFTSSGTLADDGWNMIGNPYGSTIDWNASSGFSRSNLDNTFYVWSDTANGGTGDYLSWNGSTGTFGSGKIAPWQAFWVKANTSNPTLFLYDSVRTSGGIFRKQIPVSQLGFALTDGVMSSQTVIMFDERAEVSKDGLDAYKLQSLNEDYLSLFTQLSDGSGLDINALPIDLEEEILIPLGIDRNYSKGSENSEQFDPNTFKLSWNSENLSTEMMIVLVDNEIGAEIDLREASFYNFEIENQSKAKTVKTQSLATPQHKIMKPEVVKAKNPESGSRFMIRITTGTSVSEEPEIELPTSVELQQNYPNPFNPSTTIAFGVPQSAKVTLEVFDVLGRKVATLLNAQNKTAGRHTVNFDARNLASGMYIYRLQAANSIITKKLTLIK